MTRSFHWLFVGAAATSIAFGLITFFALPAGLRLNAAQRVSWPDSLQVIRRDTRFLRVLAASFLVGMVFTLGEMISLPVGAAYVAELVPAELRGMWCAGRAHFDPRREGSRAQALSPRPIDLQ